MISHLGWQTTDGAKSRFDHDLPVSAAPPAGPFESRRRTPQLASEAGPGPAAGKPGPLSLSRIQDHSVARAHCGLGHAMTSRQPTVVSRYFVAYLASFVAVAPFSRANLKDERVQTGTGKFFDKALSKLAGWHERYGAHWQCLPALAPAARPLLGTSGLPPSIALIAPRTPRLGRPRLTVAMGRGGHPRTRRTSRIAPRRPSLHRMRPTTRACK